MWALDLKVLVTILDFFFFFQLTFYSWTAGLLELVTKMQVDLSVVVAEEEQSA